MVVVSYKAGTTEGCLLLQLGMSDVSERGFGTGLGSTDSLWKDKQDHTNKVALEAHCSHHLHTHHRFTPSVLFIHA